MSDGRPAAANDRLAGLAASPRALALDAERLLKAARPADAAERIDRALAEAGTHFELLRLRGLVDLHLGQPAAAAAALQRALAARPGDALIATQLGGALAQCGDLAGAEQWFRAACAWAPGLPDAWYNLGVACLTRGAAVAAREAFERVLAIDPRQLPARLRLAEVMTTLGELAGAEAAYRAVLAGDPHSVPAWSGLAGLGMWQPEGPALDGLLELQASGRVAGAHALSLAFACARFLERAGRHAEAWSMFVHANRRKRATLHWDSGAVGALVDSILDAFDAPYEAGDDVQRGAGILFIVGMPRSGSSVLEQILSAHPHVQGAGETNAVARLLQAESQRRARVFPQWVGEAGADDWRRLGTAYLEQAGRQRGACAWYTDKTLANWQAVGAIRRMLPGARIVHCRRDPLETLWSCFKHHFAEGQGFSYDLDELVAFWRDCTRAMQAWQARHGDIIVHEHGALLADPEQAVRRLLEGCGLGFDRACLDFHANPRAVHTASAAQVRRPLQRAPASARAYAGLLSPLVERINASGEHPRFS